MIRYALICEHDHAFEGWFAGSDAFDAQSAAGAIDCPLCGARNVRKQVMSPAVTGAKKNFDGAAGRLAEIAGKVRAHIAETHVYVGDKFAEDARAMHDGEKDSAPIYGEVTPAEAKALKDDGVPAAPLPAPFVPTPAKKIN